MNDHWKHVGVMSILLCVSATVSAQTKAEIAEAGKKYVSNCQSCHQPPNPAFAADLSWLEAIKSTA